MSWGVYCPKNGQPAGTVLSELASSTVSPQSQMPPARPSASRKDSSALNEGRSGNIRPYPVAWIGASTGARTREGARQGVRREEPTVVIRPPGGRNLMGLAFN